jgi:hypothetical protein
MVVSNFGVPEAALYAIWNASRAPRRAALRAVRHRARRRTSRLPSDSARAVRHMATRAPARARREDGARRRNRCPAELAT